MQRETIQNFCKKLYHLPPYQAITQEDIEQYFHPWGFTMYRTFYGPGSEEAWQSLLQKATVGVRTRMEELDGIKENPDVFAKVLNQFSLDPRSDPATLSGLSLEDVRQLYLDSVGGQPLNAEKGHRLFLLADDEVLQDPNLARLKVVAANYDPVAAVPTNWKFGPQRYFGWMTMPTTAIYELWVELRLFDFEQIINRTKNGGPGVFWDPWWD